MEIYRSGPTWALVTTSTALARTDAEIIKCTLFANSGGAADANVYDGMDASSILALPLRCPVNEHTDLDFPCCLRMHKGIFVEIGSNVAGVLVVYYLIS